MATLLDIDHSTTNCQPLALGCSFSESSASPAWLPATAHDRIIRAVGAADLKVRQIYSQGYQAFPYENHGRYVPKNNVSREGLREGSRPCLMKFDHFPRGSQSHNMRTC